MMNKQGVRAPSPFALSHCPRCFAKLKKKEMFERKIKKRFRCSNCGKVIDERLIVR